MKAKLATLLSITTLATSTLLAGPLIVVQTPTVVVAPAPVAPVVVVSTVPDSYTRDGTEYVGVVGAPTAMRRSGRSATSRFFCSTISSSMFTV